MLIKFEHVDMICSTFLTKQSHLLKAHFYLEKHKIQNSYNIKIFYLIFLTNIVEECADAHQYFFWYNKQEV